MSTGQRFGKRQRPYVLHEAKAGSISLLHEMGLMWSSQFRETATHPFRETVSGNADPSMMFMLAHFTVERWREALLWSFIVGKHGTLDDRWTRHSLEGAWKDLGGLDSNPILPVKGVFRETLVDIDARLKESGHVDPDPTTYEFCACRPYLQRYPLIAHSSSLITSFARRLSIRELPRRLQEQVAALRTGGHRPPARMHDPLRRMLQEYPRARVQPRVRAVQARRIREYAVRRLQCVPLNSLYLMWWAVVDVCVQ